MLAFGNGVMLLFLRGIGVPEARLIAYLTIPLFVLAVSRVPMAVLADEFGKKRVGSIGIFVGTAGFGAIATASFLRNAGTAETMALVGIIVFSLGMTLTGAGWFAILEPIVPKKQRGRFFGRIRVAWQLSGVAFSAVATWILSRYHGGTGFRILFVAIIALLLVRWIFYVKIPEIDAPNTKTGVKMGGVRQLFVSIMKTRGVAAFSAYIFLLTFFAAYCGRIFSLMEKEFLGLSNGNVVWLANLTMIGNLLGFVVGGKAVDKLGTRRVFLACHLAAPAVMLVYLTRSLGGGHFTVSLWAAHILLGVVMAAASIAVTTEMLALTPKRQKSTATSIMMSFQIAGSALAGMACAGIVKLGVLKPEWSLDGMPMNHYDTILAVCAAMLLLLLVIVGIIPTVLGKHKWIPGEELAK